MNFELIRTKFNYDEQLSNFLKDVYFTLIEYFGNENIVFEALYNTKIVSVHNVYDYLKESKFLEENDDSLVSIGDLKRSSGVNQSIPHISFNNNTNSYEITNIDRVVAVVNLDLNSTHSKGTLIHELCHLIKSYYSEYIIEGNMLMYHSGLIEIIYELSNNGVNVNKKLIKETGVGLEEGLTSVDEEEISRILFDKNYNSSGYGVVNAIARNLLAIPEIREVIINAQLYHDKKELYNRLGLEDYLYLEDLANRIYELNLEMFANIFNESKMNEAKNKILEILKEEYLPLKDKMEKNISRNNL